MKTKLRNRSVRGVRPARGRTTCQVAPALAIFALAVVCGCGGGDGPTRYRLSGEVTYQGQPVPAGYIVFAPDQAQGNEGPGAHADIVNGRYETARGEGTVGGPHLVTIAGFDGQPFEMGGGMMNPQGKPLFGEYRTTVDLPEAAGTHDFQIPAGAR